MLKTGPEIINNLLFMVMLLCKYYRKCVIKLLLYFPLNMKYFRTDEIFESL